LASVHKEHVQSMLFEPFENRHPPGRRWRTESPQCWPPSAAQTWCAVFPRHAFTNVLASALQWKVSVSPSCTNPYSPCSLRLGSCFQPQLRQHLYRCDQMRRSIQWSSLFKRVRTWARL
jgi:hypothetical protein